jgi:hypothetical protein
MKKFVLIALACFAAAGCKKAFDNLEKSAYQPDPAAGNANQGGGGGGSGGAVQAVRGAVTRDELENALKQIQIFIENASAVDGNMPSVQTTYDSLKREAPKYAKYIDDRVIVLNPARSREEVWAWAVLPQGNVSVLTSSGIERMSQQQLNTRLGR